MLITGWKTQLIFSLIILNNNLKWPQSYIKPNGIIHHQSDAAHKLFNQIDRYITNWVGYCHPSSIFLWSRSPVSAEDTLWMMSMRWNETPPDLQRDHLSIIWQLQHCLAVTEQRVCRCFLKSSAVSVISVSWGNRRDHGRWKKVPQSYSSLARLFVSAGILGDNVNWQIEGADFGFNTRVLCGFMYVFADEGRGGEFLCLNVTRATSVQSTLSLLSVCVRASACLTIHNSCWQRSQIPSQASERHRLSKWMRVRGKNCIAASRCLSWIALTEPGYLVWATRLNSTPTLSWLLRIRACVVFAGCSCASKRLV